MPRRVPSLAWLAYSPQFRRLRRTANGWIDEHFRLIETHAGRLEPGGQEVADFCVTDLTTRGLSFPRDPPSVCCQRSVVRVYGTDGSVEARLAELADALAAAGWGRPAGDGIIPLGSGYRSAAWRPAPGFGLPAGLEAMPPARQFPSWRWPAHGDRAGQPAAPGGRVLVLGMDGSQPVRRRSPIHRILEHTANVNRASPMAEATRRHEHLIAINIRFTYYNNTNANRPHGWIIKRLLPVRMTTYRRLRLSAPRQG